MAQRRPRRLLERTGAVGPPPDDPEPATREEEKAEDMAAQVPTLAHEDSAIEAPVSLTEHIQTMRKVTAAMRQRGPLRPIGISRAIRAGRLKQK